MDLAKGAMAPSGGCDDDDEEMEAMGEWKIAHPAFDRAAEANEPGALEASMRCLGLFSAASIPAVCDKPPARDS